jgi:hypothetical protein
VPLRRATSFHASRKRHGGSVQALSQTEWEHSFSSMGSEIQAAEASSPNEIAAGLNAKDRF